MRKEYFKINDGEPKPIKHKIERKVRFDELDPLNIVWHGNYASFFEEGRIALGDKYGISYLDFYNNGVSIPLKKLFFDYIQPLKFPETYTIETLLYWNEAARLDFEFCIYNSKGELMTSGYSVHVMVDEKKGILVDKPPFFKEFCEKWKAGKI